MGAQGLRFDYLNGYGFLSCSITEIHNESRGKAVSQNNFSKSMLLLYDPMRDYLVLGDAVMRHRFFVESDVP
jgi:hypothetical protein